jgi:hypothetical protein
MPGPIWPTMKFKQNIPPGCPIQLTTKIWPGRLLVFWVSEKYAGKELIRNGREATRKGDGQLISILTSNFRVVVDEWESRSLRCIEVSGKYLYKDPFSTIYVYHKRRYVLGQDFPHSLYENSFATLSKTIFKGLANF